MHLRIFHKNKIFINEKVKKKIISLKKINIRKMAKISKSSESTIVSTIKVPTFQQKNKT